MGCLAIVFVFVLWEVGCNRHDSGARIGGEEGDGEVRVILLWYVEGLDGCVCVFVYCQYGAA